MDTQFIFRVEETLEQIRRTLIVKLSEVLDTETVQEMQKGSRVIDIEDGPVWEGDQIDILMKNEDGGLIAVTDSCCALDVVELDPDTLLALCKCVMKEAANG